MIELYFEKLYRYPRIREHSFVAIPLKKGQLKDLSHFAILQEGKPVPVQTKVTARHEDGSIRYLFARMMVDLPANRGTTVLCDLNAEKISTYQGVHVEPTQTGFEVRTDMLEFTVEHHSRNIFRILKDSYKTYTAGQFEGPYLKDKEGQNYEMYIDQWEVIEAGPICAVLAAKGTNQGGKYKESQCKGCKDNGGKDKGNREECSNEKGNTEEYSNNKNIDFELRIMVYAEKPWIEISYRIINTSAQELQIQSLVFHLKASEDRTLTDQLTSFTYDMENDSTGCGDGTIDNSHTEGPVFHTRGIRDIELIEQKTPVESVRTFVGTSNYKTDFYIARDGREVSEFVDAESLIKQANEHYAEVLYGTFMVDRTDEQGGVCATVFQAQQNYPKAVKASIDGISVMLVPEGMENIVMQPGMAREQKFLLHFHSAKESIKELDNRSLIYQMPDRPAISPSIYRDAQVMLDVFPEKLNDDVEIALIGKADAHSRCYGMLNWGDSPDPGYTKQGRGNGRLVWTNNEYDFPHSCALMYARTGVRRFLDYLFVSASHWMDVDVCHYSENPLHIGGQWEHTAGHCMNGVMVCSHEWVEGLLDYYHFSGDERGLKTALGIGENVMRLLDTPMYAKAGEINARETGWALRSLTALYVETKDPKWLGKCDWIIESFRTWEKEYGFWLAPYTDNTVIRVGFMISVAVGSVMRYYREFPSEELKQMMLRAIDDLIENCLLDNGLFYYKELPSLARLGNNTLLLESLAIGYELTNDTKYLAPGQKTFAKAISASLESTNGQKKHVEDAVVCTGGGSKAFAQSFIPLITYYKALSEHDLWIENQ